MINYSCCKLPFVRFIGIVRRMRLSKLITIAVIGLFSAVPPAWSEQTKTTNPETRVQTWKNHANGVRFSITQLLPDQVRAFYVSRGFSAKQIDSYATACIFMTVLSNDRAPGVVHFVLNNWSVVTESGSRPPMDTNSLLQRLQQSGVKKPALIAFRWAQFPPEHEYEPNGDWNQGMLAAGLPTGSSFDLVVRWDVAGKPYEGVLKNVQCP